jgi:hypothetical protein
MYFSNRHKSDTQKFRVSGSNRLSTQPIDFLVVKETAGYQQACLFLLKAYYLTDIRMHVT